MRVANRDAGLANTADAFLEQASMTVVKSLTPSNEESSRTLWIEHRAELPQDLFGPVAGHAPCRNTDIKLFGRREKLVRVLEPALLNAIEPNDEGRSKRLARLRRRANKVSDHCAAGFRHPVAQPAHA